MNDPDAAFMAGWAAAVDYLKSERHKIQTTEGGIGWIARDSIDGAIALLEGPTSHSSEIGDHRA